VREILDIADSDWHNSIIFGCVGNVQALCAGFGLNDSFLVPEEGREKPAGCLPRR
jgi:hypothetical protein